MELFFWKKTGSLYGDHKCTTFNLSDCNNSTSTYTDKKLSELVTTTLVTYLCCMCQQQNLGQISL